MQRIFKNQGYTIIETMISVSIFLLIIQFGMGSLLGANSAHQKAKDMRNILDSVSFIMEDLSRNIRTGYNYQCFQKDVDTSLTAADIGAPRRCSDGWAIAFESDVGNPTVNTDQWVYYIAGGAIYKSSNGAASFIQVTPDEVSILAASSFSVLGPESPSSSVNRQQPFITIKFVGTIIYKNIVTPFSLQTSASQRLIDV